MKIVAPYRPMVSYTSLHIECARHGFDWIESLKMLRASGLARAGIETYAISDVELPVPHYRYPSKEQSLMIWMLEVSLSYLESEDFDQDTVLLGADSIVLKPFDMFGGFDIAITSRLPKFFANPLMNGWQLWPIASKVGLIRLFRMALDIAHGLPDEEKAWGADTKPLIMLLGPIKPGDFIRSGMRVRIFPPPMLMTLTISLMNKMRVGKKVAAGATTVDFKALAKLHMREYYEREFGK